MYQNKSCYHSTKLKFYFMSKGEIVMISSATNQLKSIVELGYMNLCCIGIGSYKVIEMLC